MSKTLFAIGLAVGAMFALPGATSASHDPSGQPFGEDFVVGSFSTGGGSFTIDAHSGPSGEDPTGEVRVVTGLGAARGRVTCLNVAGNRATIGIEFPPGIGSGFFFVEDNDGAGHDRQGGVATSEVPSVCPANPSTTLLPISRGDITVHDAPAFPTSKEQCKNGGWRQFGFKNEGRCVAFVNRGPKH
jgi:hypothetical protein